jgi:hypothetical protein
MKACPGAEEKLLVFLLMNSYPSKFDDPKVGVEREFLESCQCLFNQILKSFQGWIPRESDDDNSAAKIRGEPYWTGKIQIKSHKTALFIATNLKYLAIFATAKFFTQDSLDIISGVTKQILCPISEIFVKLKFHTAFSIGISTYLSRDISAAYAMAAKMSSLVNCGYSLITSSTDIPFAIRSRIRETHILVPLMHGLPKETLGFTMILLSSSFISSYLLF